MSQPTAKSCDKKNKAAEFKIQKILNKIQTLNLSSAYISQLPVPVKEGKGKLLFISNPKMYCAIAVTVLVIAMGLKKFYDELMTKVSIGGGNTSKQTAHLMVSDHQSCLLEVPSSCKTLFRPPEDCSMCVGLEGVVRLANTSAQEFEEHYAYSAAPVIVTDATRNWRAMKEFDFKFFAQFYQNGKMGKQINDCFFFAYKSGLRSLDEVFSMDEARANLSAEPWYVGWSTCHSEETRQLRNYYDRPYFLPETAESDIVDWIFMGGPGQGAHMHVDSVKHMSWQAQIRGRKQWQLAPPPECLYHCRWLSFTVEPGDILVVDTNRWYHKTNVMPGDMSITIGAEYD